MSGKIPCTRCGHPILPVTASLTGGLCRPCDNHRKSDERARILSEEPVDEGFELAPENAHPTARTLLRQDFFWSIADDGAPFGSDTGADTLAMFREWRQEHPRANPERFLANLLREWDVPDRGWSDVDEAVLAKSLPKDHYAILTRDDAAIALAFAQLVLEGRVAESIRVKALFAIQRQQFSVVLEFRGWTDKAERVERLAAMREAIESAA